MAIDLKREAAIQYIQASNFYVLKPDASGTATTRYFHKLARNAQDVPEVLGKPPIPVVAPNISTLDKLGLHMVYAANLVSNAADNPKLKKQKLIIPGEAVIYANNLVNPGFLERRRDEVEFINAQTGYKFRTRAMDYLLDIYASQFSAFVQSAQNRGSADPENIAQESFLKAYQAADRFEFRSTVNTWVFSIMINEIGQELRARINRPIIHYDQDQFLLYKMRQFVDPDPLPDQVVINDFERSQIETALKSLNPESRVAVVLRDVEELSTSIAARIAKTEEGALKSRLHRGRKELRTKLGYLRDRQISTASGT